MLIYRPVDPTIVSDIYIKLFDKISVNASKITALDIKNHEIRKDYIETDKYRSLVALYTNGIIIVNIIYRASETPEIMYLFNIVDYINDDSVSLVYRERGRKLPTKALIQKKHMINAIMSLLFRGGIDRKWSYKNKLKIKSSQYGDRIHDVSIVCLDD